MSAKSKSTSARARGLVELGLERFRNGDLQAALALWHSALEVDPENGHARSLVDFAHRQLAEAGDVPEFLEGWELGEGTSPETEIETVERVRQAEKAVARPPRRKTIESPLSAMLAPLTNTSADAAAVSVDLLEETLMIVEAERVPGEGSWQRSEVTPTVPLAVEAALAVDGELTRSASGVEAAPRPGQTPGPTVEDPIQGLRRRVSERIERCRSDLRAGDVDAAAELAERALQQAEGAPPPGIAEVIEPARKLFERVFEAHIGPPDTTFVVTMPTAALATVPLDARAAFLVSRVEGPTSLEQLLDLSGMSRFETLRIVSLLMREGIVRPK